MQILTATHRPVECSRRSRVLVVWAATAAFAVAFVGLVLLAPFSLTRGRPLLAFALYEAFSHVCHQIPERSFYLGGFPLAVCARCFGLYLGFMAAALFYPLLRRPAGRERVPHRLWLVLALLPMAFDFGLDFVGLWQNTHLSRSMTGALVGGVTVFYVIPTFLDLWQAGWRKFFAPSPANKA